MADQFELLEDASPLAPLADRLRPRSLDEFSGQQHLLGDNSTLRSAIAVSYTHLTLPTKA